MSTPVDKANLARIRDNQRRSRARRKEYLQELEQRLRLCELQGVEASAEIQSAARRVADENRRLRLLLHDHGIADDAIDAFLLQQQQQQTQPHPGGRAVQDLAQLLGVRRPACLDPDVPFDGPSRPCDPSGGCCGGGGGGGGGGDNGRLSTASRETSVSSIATSHSMWAGSMPDAAHHFGRPLSSSLPPPQLAPAPAPAPAPALAMAPAPPQYLAMQGLGPGLEDARTARRSIGGQSDGGGGTAGVGGRGGGGGGGGCGGGPDNHHGAAALYPFDMQGAAMQHSAMVYPHQQRIVPSHQAAPSRGNCAEVTHMLSGITGADPQQVRAHLGCPPGGDCEVDHLALGDVLVQYVGEQIDL